MAAPGLPQSSTLGGTTGLKFGGCLAALTMIKKALPFRFPLMSQADRMADRLAGVVSTILWGIPGALWTFLWNRRPSGAIPTRGH
jgi:hypothetical protein